MVNDFVGDILYFSHVPWHSLMQRPHHFAKLLSKNHRLVYVNPTGYSWITPIYYRLKGKKSPHIGYGINEITPMLWVYTPPLNPLHFHYELEWITEINTKFQIKRLRKIMESISFSPDVVWITYPHYVKHFGKYNESIDIYDCLDDFLLLDKRLKWRAPLLQKFENQIAKDADIIFASSKILYDRFQYRNSCVRLLPNAAEVEHFDKETSPNQTLCEVNDIRHPRIGYVGMISEWFDFDLITYLLGENKKASVVCIGPWEGVDINQYSGDRLIFLGSRPYDELPTYLNTFDVLIIPFRINNLTKAVNPIKLYEYLATGKPIVTTNLPEANAFDDVVYISRNFEEFVKNIQIALEETGQLNERRKEIARKNGWEDRMEVIEKVLKAHFGS